MKRLGRLLLSSVAVLALIAQPAKSIPRGGIASGSIPPANTYLVYSGCTQPSSTLPATNYYVDSVNGSDSNNGLAPGSGHAWATLGHALTTPSSAGNYTVNMYTGTYNAVDVSVNFSSFVYVVAVAGQTPLFTGEMHIHAASKVLFQGLKFQDTASAFQSFALGDGTVSDVVFYGNDFSSAPFATVQGWTAAQWRSNARWVGIEFDSGAPQTAPTINCIAVDNNTFHYERIGFQLIGNSLMLHGNTLDWLGDDFMDWAGSSVEVSGNTGTNSLNIGDSNHNDFAQAQAGDCVAGVHCTNTNVVVKNNAFYELFSPAAQVPLTSQGTLDEAQCISFFNNNTSIFSIYNNVCVTSADSNLSIESMQNGDVANNTVIDTSSFNGGITLSKFASDGDASTGVHMWNNIGTLIGYDFQDATVTIDHSLILVGGKLYYNLTGSTVFQSSPGTYLTAAVVTSNANSTVFTTYDPTTPTWTLTLIGGSIAIAAGTLPAPACINGTARGSNPDEGAYC